MSNEHQQLNKHTEYRTIVITLPVRTITTIHALAIEKQESLSQVVERLAKEEMARKEGKP